MDFGYSFETKSIKSLEERSEDEEGATSAANELQVAHRRRAAKLEAQRVKAAQGKWSEDDGATVGAADELEVEAMSAANDLQVAHRRRAAKVEARSRAAKWESLEERSEDEEGVTSAANELQVAHRR